MVEGGEEAASVKAALIGLGAVNPDFATALSALGNLAGELQRIRGEAIATAVANTSVVDVSGNPQSYAGQDRAPPKPKVETVSVKDTLIPPGGGRGPRWRQVATRAL
jgi:hypothetical protein